jgi:NAD-dependent deacetylase
MNLSLEFERILQECESVCVLTGAGISAESGVPTFRGADGLWNKFRPEELASIDAFMKNPYLVWEWYNYRRQLIDKVQPNKGHEGLAEMERLVHHFTLVTQNVDGLHQRAGSSHVIELHGNIQRNYCMDCGNSEEHPQSEGMAKVPKCKRCGGLIRPGVVWFGEMLPDGIFDEAETSASQCDLFLSIGTSGVVYPAASLPLAAKRAGAYLVEINIELTEMSGRFNQTLVGKAGELVPAIVERLKTRTRNAL